MKDIVNKYYAAEILPLDRPILSKDEFVRLYLPQYVRDYRPPAGIRMAKGVSGSWHVQISTKASVQAQLTKRENRINEAYSQYVAIKKSQMERDKQATDPTLPL